MDFGVCVENGVCGLSGMLLGELSFSRDFAGYPVARVGLRNSFWSAIFTVGFRRGLLRWMD